MKYELTIIDENGDVVTVIGTFNDEDEIARWAAQNRGELEAEK